MPKYKFFSLAESLSKVLVYHSNKMFYQSKRNIQSIVHIGHVNIFSKMHC